MRRWRIEDSAELYNINGWGLKYFSINDKGHVAVTPREGNASVDLMLHHLFWYVFRIFWITGSKKSQNVLSRLQRSMATRHRILSFIR